MALSIKPRKAETDWTNTLNPDDKIPRGTYVFYNELGNLFPGAKILKTDLRVYNAFDSLKISPDLLFILHNEKGINSGDLDKSDLNALVQYAEKGGIVFLATNSVPQSFHKKYSLEMGTSFMDKILEKGVRMKDSTLWDKKFYTCKTKDGFLNRFFVFDKDSLACSVLGVDALNHPNFIKIHTGKGAVYMHSEPEVFTNFFLLTGSNSDYVSNILSYLPKSIKNIEWNTYYYSDHINLSPMEYVFTQPNLRLAAICILFFLFLFATIQIKRRQRFIPIIPPPNNQTLEFITTLGLLYFEKNDNKNLSEKMILQFREYLRKRYTINLDNFTHEEIPFLTVKLGKDPKEIEQLINEIRRIQHSSFLSENEILTFNQNLQRFYK